MKMTYSFGRGFFLKQFIDDKIKMKKKKNIITENKYLYDAYNCQKPRKY